MTELWIPGPTYVRPEILAECTHAMIGHRSRAMEELIERVDPGLALAFGFTQESGARAAVAPCSATGMMEGSLYGAGERVLSIVGGAFGKRWGELAACLGKRVRVLDVEWGDVIDPAELERVLAEEGPFDAVTMVSNETSTGAFTPIARVSDVLRAHPDTLLLVDVVSLIAGAPIDFDASGADFALAGVQKALALPPGITVFCASERYVSRARARQRRGWYLDPITLLDGHAERNTPTTPTIPLFYALAKQLDDISAGVTLPASERGATGAEAWRARFEKHARMRARTLEWAESRGLSPLPPREFASPTISCIRADGIATPAFLTGLQQAGFQIGNGYGALKNKTFRVGHMGDHTEERLDALLAAAERVLG